MFHNIHKYTAAHIKKALGDSDEFTRRKAAQLATATDAYGKFLTTTKQMPNQ